MVLQVKLLVVEIVVVIDEFWFNYLLEFSEVCFFYLFLFLNRDF